MENTISNVSYLKEILKPEVWDRLSSKVKHRLVERVSEEHTQAMIAAELRKVKRDIKREGRSVLDSKEILEAL